ncbi:hypothetical protein EYF80_060814 [Liparis tanakae]|uniref:Uncharacterized protein n=1 Tax=Liparis tanakae TaxID=230148 RepID=A0A4Z2EJU8_9TELE|nr:hypothetical protein EYF80_060814 [Liparis tanakae]
MSPEKKKNTARRSGTHWTCWSDGHDWSDGGELMERQLEMGGGGGGGGEGGGRGSNLNYLCAIF